MKKFEVKTRFVFDGVFKVKALNRRTSRRIGTKALRFGYRCRYSFFAAR